MKKSIIIGLVLAAAACTGVSPDSRFYALQTENNAVPVCQKRLKIVVSEVKVPDYLDRPQIVTAEPNSPEVQRAEFDRWNEDLPAMMSRVLAQNLTVLLPKAIARYQDFSSDGFDMIVEAEVIRFDGTLNGEATADIWWTLRRKNGAVIRQERFESSRPVGKSYASLVEAYSSEIGEWAGEVAEAACGK